MHTPSREYLEYVTPSGFCESFSDIDPSKLRLYMNGTAQASIAPELAPICCVLRPLPSSRWE